MKIWLVKTNWTHDGLENGSDAVVYSTFEEAKKALEKEIFEIKHVICPGWETNPDWVVDEDVESFCVYENGRYYENHDEVHIEESIIEGCFLEKSKIDNAKKCLVDNGIEADEVSTVLQALCYILLDEEIESEESK